MEALGVASSIAGLISLADVLAFKVSRYYSLVKSARSDIRELLVEVQSLYGVLNSLKLLATCLEDTQPDSDEKITIPQLDHFQTCRQNLDFLSKSLIKIDLDSASPLAAAKAKLSWPFKSSETKDLIEKIARNKRDLSDALTADGLTALISALSVQSELIGRLDNVHREQLRVAEEKAEHELDEHRKKVFEWCSTVNPYEKHRNAKSLRHPNTVLWFFDSPEYKKWIEEPNSAIWLFGIPGAGKTILTSAVIEEAKLVAYTNPRFAIAYYYCEYKLQETQRLSNILGSLIKQVGASSDEAFETLDLFYKDFNEKAKHPILPTAEELVKLLKRMSRDFECVMIIVDGLDECSLPDERGNMLQMLSRLNAPEHSNIKTVYTSRDEVDIRGHFIDYDSISIAARGKDLELYVAAGIELRINNKSLRLKDPALREIIINGIVSKANGMFQWAKCQLDHLCLLSTDRERRKALETLPKDLFETYRRILYRVNDSTAGNQRLVEKALRWLAFAEESLSIDELITAVAIEIRSTYINQDDLPDEESLLWWCSSLVSKDEKTGVVALSHFTVKEFLMDEKLLDIPSLKRYYMDEKISNCILAKVCLTYLGFRDFSRTSRDHSLDVQQKLKFYPLLKYVATHWRDHSRGCDEDDIMFDLSCCLFNPLKPANFILWLEIYFWKRKKETPRAASTLHLAASLGLTRVCRWLIEKNVDIDFNDTMLGSPLICAIRGSCRWGDTFASPTPEIVEMILAHGACANTKMAVPEPAGSEYSSDDGFSDSPSDPEDVEDMKRKFIVRNIVTPMSLTLDMADDEHRLCCSIFKHLINFGAVSSFADSEFWSRTHSWRDNNRLAEDWIELFAELLDHPSASSLDSESKEKMLNFIAKYGESDEDEKLVAGQAMGDHVFKSIESVSQLVVSAAENGQTHLIKSLIDHHADPRALSQGLLAAAESGLVEVVNILLEHCPLDDPAVFNHVQSAWIGAARYGSVECLKIFLKYNIDINVVVEAVDDTLLEMPAKRGHRTALAQAVINSTLHVVEFFSTISNADFGIVDDKGCNLLHLAVQAPLHRAEMARLLLGKGLKVSERSADGRTVLHYLLGNEYALDSKDLQLIQLFMDHGCNVDVVDNEGNNLMHSFFRRSSHYIEYLDHIIALLIGDGSIWSRPNEDGFLPVQFAIIAQLPSSIIRMALPKTLALWNSVQNATFSPLHQAALGPSSTIRRRPGGMMEPPPPPRPPRKRLPMTRPNPGKLPPQPIYRHEEDTFRVLKVLLEVHGINLNVVDNEGRTPLLVVAANCWSGSGRSAAEAIKELLERGSEINMCDSHNWTALHHVMAAGFELGLRELLQFSPDLNARSLQGQTPLHVAITHGPNSHSTINMLLQATENHSKLNNAVQGEQLTNSGLLPIHLAAQTGRSDFVQILHDFGQIPNINIPTSNTEKATPLHLAVCAYLGEKIPTLRLLLHLGADVNSTNSIQETPLHVAAREGYKSMAEFLIERGASLIAEDASGFQPWMLAAIGGHRELRMFLEKATRDKVNNEVVDDESETQMIGLGEDPSGGKNQNEGPTTDSQTSMRRREVPKMDGRLVNSFREAIEDGDEYVCRMLLDSGIDPNTTLDDEKRTALHLACRSGSAKVVEQLLKSGADMSLKANYGNQPMHIAAIKGFSGIIKILAQAGASIKERNMAMQTPLHLASDFGNLEAARMILDLDSTHCDEDVKSSILEARDEGQETPLLYAFRCNEVEIAKLLLERGANIEARDTLNRNGFWYAARCADKSFIETLITQVQDINVTDYAGFNCLHNAARRRPEDRPKTTEEEITEIALLLIRSGAAVSRNQPSNTSPLHCACDGGNVSLIKKLLEILPSEEVNVESKYFGTPLYTTAFFGMAEAVKVLLEAGADMNVGKEGESPLEAAEATGQKAVVDILKRHRELLDQEEIPTSS